MVFTNYQGFVLLSEMLLQTITDQYLLLCRVRPMLKLLLCFLPAE